MENGDQMVHRELAYAVVGAAMEVHRELGPGFLESIYQGAMETELALRRIPFQAQKSTAVEYKGVHVGTHILDLVVDEKIIVELKAATDLTPVNESQVLSYLKATRLGLGLLINFGRPSLQTKRLALTMKVRLPTYAPKPLS